MIESMTSLTKNKNKKQYKNKQTKNKQTNKSEFQGSQGYTEKPCLKKTKQTNKQNKNKNKTTTTIKPNKQKKHSECIWDPLRPPWSTGATQE